MAEVLSPFVYWGQGNDFVSLKIDLRDIEDEVVDLREDSLTFYAQGNGLKGNNQYGFDIDFYLPVDSEESKYRVTETSVEFHIKKVGEGEVWPRLTHKQMKLPWLKIDFDKFMDESDKEQEEQELYGEKEFLDRIEKEIGTGDATAKTPNFKLSYIFMYNLFQFIGFLYVTVILLYKFFRYGEEIKHTAFEAVGVQLMVCQAVACLEVIHPMLGLVKSGVFAPLAQVFGRNFILFGLLLQEPRLHSAPAVWYLFVVWSAVELIRYPFYMLSSINMEVKFINWMRYTVWIPLYPLGILFEGTIVIMSIPLFEQTGRFSVTLPNSANFAFFFPWFLHTYLFLLALAGYKMMNYMYYQRKKKLGDQKLKTT
ncbi:very-long-chain (3R)-3-hydroxyacyl-CoA dehydratase 3-like [Haliotis rufescens]|uniref:very-long-chain (3R)-3-hydroxyacyl-CoA dehydratase 3-like n=1 Tax=Haliotis rufescens TaxID=6454 RepID=UPI001EAFC272|nr:very-long-chain (3R)-3-hydroxyacyl-CoA dehydratase 3-like [Haliotis rufescens]